MGLNERSDMKTLFNLIIIASTVFLLGCWDPVELEAHNGVLVGVSYMPSGGFLGSTPRTVLKFQDGSTFTIPIILDETPAFNKEYIVKTYGYTADAVKEVKFFRVWP